MIKPVYRKLPTCTRGAPRLAAPSRDWNVFKQLLAEHWDGFTHAHPRSQTPSYHALVAQRLACGNPEKIGDLAYRCLPCGQEKPGVALSCQASLCWRCANVSVDHGVRPGRQGLHAGGRSRHILLTVPARCRTTFSHHAAVLWSAVRRCGVQCREDCDSEVRGQALQGG
jgi:hypothetical protein